MVASAPVSRPASPTRSRIMDAPNASAAPPLAFAEPTSLGLPGLAIGCAGPSLAFAIRVNNAAGHPVLRVPGPHFKPGPAPAA